MILTLAFLLVAVLFARAVHHWDVARDRRDAAREVARLPTAEDIIETMRTRRGRDHGEVLVVTTGKDYVVPWCTYEVSGGLVLLKPATRLERDITKELSECDYSASLAYIPTLSRQARRRAEELREMLMTVREGPQPDPIWLDPLEVIMIEKVEA